MVNNHMYLSKSICHILTNVSMCLYRFRSQDVMIRGMHGFGNTYQSYGCWQLAGCCRQHLMKLKTKLICKPLSKWLSKSLSTTLINWEHLSMVFEATVEAVVDNAKSDTQIWHQNYDISGFSIYSKYYTLVTGPREL